MRKLFSAVALLAASAASVATSSDSDLPPAPIFLWNEVEVAEFSASIPSMAQFHWEVVASQAAVDTWSADSLDVAIDITTTSDTPVLLQLDVNGTSTTANANAIAGQVTTLEAHAGDILPSCVYVGAECIVSVTIGVSMPLGNVGEADVWGRFEAVGAEPDPNTTISVVLDTDALD